jgi:hypothetical protein
MAQARRAPRSRARTRVAPGRDGAVARRGRSSGWGVCYGDGTPFDDDRSGGTPLDLPARARAMMVLGFETEDGELAPWVGDEVSRGRMWSSTATTTDPCGGGGRCAEQW